MFGAYPLGKYILAHWRGEQGLLRSTLLNSVIIYFVLVLGLVVMGKVTNNQISVFTGLAVCLLFLIWAFVGMLRCGTRYAFDKAMTKTSSPHYS
jgi:hypothetical protein